MKALGADLLGSNVKSQEFPLLIKLLDAREALSVQVHPDDESAKQYGGQPKTEMWFVLEADPGAGILAGFSEGVTPERFEEAVKGSEFEKMLVRVPVEKGDAVYIPGGLVHAIDAGCLLLEVQQNSNTTYRIYDWERVGKDGKPRRLDIKEALEVIRWDAGGDAKVAQRQLSKTGINEVWEVLRTPYFRMERFEIGEYAEITNDGSSFHVLFIASGGVHVEWDAHTAEILPGTSCLMPAALSEYTLEPLLAKAEVLRISVP